MMTTTAAAACFDGLTVTGVTLSNKILGAGAYGSVVESDWHGTPCVTKQLHAVFHHLLPPHELESLVMSFCRECTTWASLRHPHIVQFLGVFFPNDPHSALPALVLERMQQSLRHYLEQHDKTDFPLFGKVIVLHQISQALSYLHSKTPPLVHHDLSPNNILINEVGFVAKLTDFGMTRAICMNRQTSVKGTHSFMPPEALQHPPRYNQQLDVFSFGNVIISILTHQWPEPGPPNTYEGNTLVAQTEFNRRKQFIKLFSQREQVLFLDLVRSCLENRPEVRPRSTELVKEVKRIEDLLVGESSQQPHHTSEMQAVLSAREVALVSSRQELTSTKQELNSTKSELSNVKQELASMKQELEKLRVDHVRRLSEEVGPQDSKSSQGSNMSRGWETNPDSISSAECEPTSVWKPSSDDQSGPECSLSPEGGPSHVHEPTPKSSLDSEHPSTPKDNVSPSDPPGPKNPPSIECQKPEPNPPQPHPVQTLKQLVWSTGPDPPMEIDFPIAAQVDQFIYVGDRREPRTHISRLDIRTMTWSMIPLPNGKRRKGFCLVSTPGLLHLIGGRCRDGGLNVICNEVWSLSASKQWEESLPLICTDKGVGNAVAVSLDSCILVAGGESMGQRLTTVSVINTRAETPHWVKVPPLPVGIGNPQAVVHNGHVLVGFGNGSSDILYQAPVDSLKSLADDPSKCDNPQFASLWTALPRLPVTNPGVTVVRQCLLSVGGWSSDSRSFVYCYDTVSGQWVLTSEARRARSLLSVVTVTRDTRELIFVFGGSTSASPCEFAELVL